MYQKIEQITFEFYKIATTDILIGYHFKRIQDFNTHIPHIARFWFTRLFPGEAASASEPVDNSRYHFLKAHSGLGIKSGEIDRWVKLFLENLSASSIDEDLKKRWEQEVIKLSEILRKNLS